MYDTMLVPHAGTPAGDVALKHALHAAKGTSAKIVMLHIIEELQHPLTFALAESERESMINSIKEANESMRQEMQKEMESRTQQCKDANVECDLKVEIGDAAEIILENIDELKPDLVVMAKRRKLKGVRKLLSLGSVSRKVIEHAACPVLLIDIERL